MTNKCIHDYDIKRWAMKIARQVGHDTFKASNFWIRNFKKNGIVSRKITKFTTKKVTANQIDIFANAATFVGEIAEIIRSNSPECVFNSDQSGFNEEFHSMEEPLTHKERR